MATDMTCADVRREISDYVDGTVPAPRRRRLRLHFAKCRHCKAVLEGTRNVVNLTGDKRAFELSAEVSRRLFAKLEQHLKDPNVGSREVSSEIPVGITDDRVPLGSHLIYFWENDQDFERGVRFLYPGLGAAGEHCIIFGHDEALQKVLGILRSKGYDPDELIRNLDLTVLRRHASVEATLANINDVAQACLNKGATTVRFLGNLGMGRDPLPAGEDDVLELETKVSALISAIPCVVVCMYDVRTLSGRMILKGGLQSHSLAVCSEGVRANPYFERPHLPIAPTLVV
jgi:MEDS: MEthanogen/methylotroph, DcmR Sensory domain/Putative zinc-finger